MKQKMPLIDLKTQITNLMQLQTLDTEIYALKKELAEKPQVIKALDDAFQQKKEILANLEKNSLDLQKQKKDREGDLAAKEESAKKLQAQLYQLKTNKEYHTMLEQIAGVKADASVVEDKILELFEQVDKIKVDAEKEKQHLQEEEKVLGTEKKKIDDRTKEIEGRLAQLEAQRQQVAPLIDQKIYAQYERILCNRDGLAIVAVEDNSCQGCNMLVPPQVINLIKMYERIITCEVCNRILFIKNEAA